MREGIPVFKKDNLLYYREEKNEFFTITSKIHPEAKELIINSTAKKILELADGSRNINEIEKEFLIRYPNVPKDKIKRDVLKTLSSFSRLGLIEWKGENPFLYRYEEPINENYSLYVAQEDNIRELEGFIKSKEGGNIKDNFIIYKNPLILDGEYSEVSLRQKLFSYNEEFFLIKNKNKKIEGLISISLPIYYNLYGGIIKLIIAPSNYLGELLSYSVEYFPFLTIKDVAKIYIYETNKKTLNSLLKEVLTKVRFQKEGELKNELGFGIDLIIYSFFYKEDFIKKVNEQRKKFI